MAVIRSEVAERYAEALFELARDADKLSAVEGDLDAIARALAESDDLKRLVRSPVFGRAQKAKGFEAILSSGDADPMTKNFIGVLARNGRISELSEVIAGFKARATAHRGEIHATAISATPLDDAQKDALKQQIEQSVGKTVNLSTEVDAGLLGGLVVRVGSRMIDSSLRTKLNRLQQSLKEA